MNRLVRERYSFVQLTPTIRRRLEATLDNLVELLDAIDGDPDDEPLLGAPESRPDQSQAFWSGKNSSSSGDYFVDEREATTCEFDPDYAVALTNAPALGAWLDDDREDGGDIEHAAQPLTLNGACR